MNAMNAGELLEANLVDQDTILELFFGELRECARCGEQRSPRRQLYPASARQVSSAEESFVVM